jgi:hypothetical protein
MAEIYSVRLQLRELEGLVAELTHVVPNPSQSDLPEIWHTFVCKKGEHEQSKLIFLLISKGMKRHI